MIFSAFFVAFKNRLIVAKLLNICLREKPRISIVLKLTPAAGTILASRPVLVPTNKISSSVAKLRSFNRSISAIMGYICPPVPPPVNIILILFRL